MKSKSYSSPRHSTAWLVCLSAGLFFFYEFFQLNIFDVINQPLRNSFHLSATEIGWMSSAYLWADILFLLPAGIILDRYSTRGVILSALLLCILGTFGFAITQSFYFATFSHFLSGIGNAFCFLSCAVLVSRWFPPSRQAFAIGSLVTMAFLGGMMAHTPFAKLSAYYGWRGALYIDGFIGLLFLLWIFLFVKDTPEATVRKKESEAMLLNLRAAILNRHNWLAGLYTALLNLPILVLCALWGASYLKTVHHFSILQASNTVSLIFIGSILGCPLLGWISDRQGQRKPMMIGGALATLLTLCPLLLSNSLSPAAINLLFFALGFFTSTQVISYPLIAESNSTTNVGTATSLASILIMGGGGVGQVLFGFLMQYHSNPSKIYTAENFKFAMWMFLLAAAIALLTTFLMRETYCKPLK